MNIETRIQTVSPEMACRILNECRYSHQRIIRPRLVARYAADMKAGRWNPGSVIEFTNVGEACFLINGQHRLSALADALAPQDFLFKFEALPDMEAVARRYYTADTGGARTITEAINSTDATKKTGLTATEIKAVLPAARYIAAGFDTTIKKDSLLSPDQSLRLLAFWCEPAREFFDAIDGCPKYIKYRLATSAVLAVALVTFRYQCSDAKRFWSRAAANDGLRAGEPEKVLLDYVLSNTATKKGHDTHARRVANAWCAAFEKRSINSTGVKNPNAYINIAGTPFLYTRRPLGMGMED